MNTPRRAAHRLFFTRVYVDLCPDCMAVLAKEGEVAGDPREPAVTFAGHRRTEPAPLGVPCDTCASLEAYEDALNASRALSGQPVAPVAYGLDAAGVHVLGSAPTCTVCGECEPVAAYGGWCCARALETPTLAEMEGEDMPQPRGCAELCDAEGCRSEGACSY